MISFSHRGGNWPSAYVRQPEIVVVFSTEGGDVTKSMNAGALFFAPLRFPLRAWGLSKPGLHTLVFPAVAGIDLCPKQPTSLVH